MGRRPAGDARDRFTRLQDCGGIGVEVEVALLDVRVAPGDHEHLLALLDQPLDQAAPGREVEHVVLVDRRRRDQQRHLANLRGLRLVLDELEHLGAQHHRARSHREVLPHREAARVDRRRPAGEVVQEAARAPDQVRAALVDARLQDGRVGPREVGRRERVEDVARGEPRLALGTPAGVGVGDQSVDGLPRRQVGLQQPPEHPVRLPCHIGEAPVALGGPDLRAPGRHLGELAPQVADPVRGATGPARQPRGDADGGARPDEARAGAVSRVCEQNVERGTGRLWGLRHCDHLSGFLIEDLTLALPGRAVIRIGSPCFRPVL